MPRQPNTIRGFRILSNGDSIRSRIVQLGNDVLDFTHQLETWLDGRWVPMVRYDCAHGAPHRDTLDRNGYNVGKRPMREGISLSTASNEALNDLTVNADTYREAFLERTP